MQESKKYTTQPVTVGSSVIGILYDKGVIIASDNRITSYGYKKYTKYQELL